MLRVVLVHGDHRILLPEGDTLVGRALHCDVRFNDRAVSREHVRIVVERGRVLAENLSGSNGTLVNGMRVDATVLLEDGDRLRVGRRDLAVELIREERKRGSRPITLDRPDEISPGVGLLVDDATAAEEATRPSGHDWAGGESTGVDPPVEPVPERRASPAASVAALAGRARRCARCRAELSGLEESCPNCRHIGVLRFSGAVTEEIDLEQVQRRLAPRYAITVPVIYASDLLTFEATAYDVSEGGIFVGTELLDPVGTDCQLTAFPEGHPAIALAGVVVHVATRATEHGRPAGLGIRFTVTSPEARRWINELRTRSVDRE